jgi:hypothetical protein
MTENEASEAKKQRDEMIETELSHVLEAARDFCYEHYEDDMEEVAIEAIKKAAQSLAYRKRYFDVMKDVVIYLPTCQKLILSRDLIEEAEKHYYDDGDEFPVEYAKALRAVVFEKKKAKEDTNSDTGEINDEEFMEKLGTEWAEAL